MTFDLSDLSPSEQFACRLAEATLDAVAEPWDIKGRQNAVDAYLHLNNGARVPFEVVRLANGADMQLDSLLSRSNFRWPNPGRWWWTIQIADVQHLEQLRERYQQIILLCEAHGVTSPGQLWDRSWRELPDIEWLFHSKCDMWGHPEVPAREGSVVRDVDILPAGCGGGVDHSLRGLAGALATAFAAPPFPRHFEKLAQADGEQRHLFVPVHLRALPFPENDALIFGDRLPPSPPPIPETVTHLWLAPQMGDRFLVWTLNGWEQHLYPRNDQRTQPATALGQSGTNSGLPASQARGSIPDIVHRDSEQGRQP